MMQKHFWDKQRRWAGGWGGFAAVPGGGVLGVAKGKFQLGGVFLRSKILNYLEKYKTFQ